ncbi:TolC family protein [Escherichia coli]|uniref:TolC family protein n=1 Tax=Escherichia coli TaxID=562 RepID=UPI000F85F4BF|nr:TolC family protein [Escherichia coli]
MKSIFILLTVIFLEAPSAIASVCSLDSYFNKSMEYRSYQIQSEQNKIERQDNNYSFLPDFSVSTGQSAYNKSGFKSPEYSDAGFYLSMPIYTGGRYFLNKNKLSLSDELQLISLEKYRIDYLLSIYEKILRRNEINTLLKEYNLKQKDAEIENKHLQYLYEQGRISAFELNLKENMVENNQKNIKILRSELQLLEWSLSKEHHIPQHMFGLIDSNAIKACKRNNISSLIKKENIAEFAEAGINYELEKSTDYPSLSLSLSLRPKKGGAIRDVSIKHGNYSTSINLNIPLSGLLKLNTKKEKYSLNVNSAKLKSDKKNMELKNTKQSILNKLDNASDEILYLRKQFLLNKDKINYLKEQLRKNNDNIVLYYNEINSLDEIKRELIKKENEIELYKMHVFFIG